MYRKIRCTSGGRRRKRIRSDFRIVGEYPRARSRRFNLLHRPRWRLPIARGKAQGKAGKNGNKVGWIARCHRRIECNRVISRLLSYFPENVLSASTERSPVKAYLARYSRTRNRREPMGIFIRRQVNSHRVFAALRNSQMPTFSFHGSYINIAFISRCRSQAASISHQLRARTVNAFVQHCCCSAEATSG